MTTLAEKIAVMQAAERGERIEWRLAGLSSWEPITEPSWNWSDYDYRIAPKPKKKIVLRQAVIKIVGGYYIPNYLYDSEPSGQNMEFVRWLGEPVEIEVEE